MFQLGDVQRAAGVVDLRDFRVEQPLRGILILWLAIRCIRQHIHANRQSRIDPFLESSPAASRRGRLPDSSQ